MTAEFANRAIGLASGAEHDAVLVEALTGEVIAVKPGPGDLEAVVAIPRGIDEAARNSNADFGIRVTATCLSVNNTIDTLDSGRKSVKNDTFRVCPGDSCAYQLRPPGGARRRGRLRLHRRTGVPFSRLPGPPEAAVADQ